MRLTLRTLLAWRDRVLPEVEQDELNLKIESSAIARQLADRMSLVVGRKRLAAPRVIGKGLGGDANSVAEYLDNTLDPTKLEPLERILLESDIQLAEVTATHELLAAIVSDDEACKPLDATGRSRLLAALIPWMTSSPESPFNEKTSLHETKGDHNNRYGISEVDEVEEYDENGMPIVDTVKIRRSNAEERKNRADRLEERAAMLSVVAEESAIEAIELESVSRARSRRSSTRTAWISAGVAIAILVVLVIVLAQSVMKMKNGNQKVARDANNKPVANNAQAAARPAFVPAAGLVPAVGVGEINREDRETQGEIDPRDSEIVPSHETDSSDEGSSPNSGVAENAADVPPPDQSPEPPTSDEESMTHEENSLNASSDESQAEPVDESPFPEESPFAIPKPLVAPKPQPKDPGVSPSIAPDDAVAIVSPRTPSGLKRPSLPGAEMTQNENNEPDPATPSQQIFGTIGATPLVLQKVEALGVNAWKIAKKGSPISSHEEFLVPAAIALRPEIVVRGVTIRLEQVTLAIVEVGEDNIPSIEVLFGRAMMQSNDPNATIRVRAGGLSGTIESGLSQPFGIEVQLHQPNGANPEVNEAVVKAVFATTGRSQPLCIRWSKESSGADGQSSDKFELSSTESIQWDSRQPGSWKKLSGPRNSASLDWLVSPATKIEKYQQSVGESLAKGIESKESLVSALLELAGDKRSENRIAAVSTLALLGQYDELIELLSKEKQDNGLKDGEWTQMASSIVPLALSRGIKSATRFRESLEKKSPVGTAELLYKLINGYSNDELEAGEDQVLIDALDNEHMVVRRYAILKLLDIVEGAEWFKEADRQKYKVDRSEASRKESLKWWRQQLDQKRIRRVSKDSKSDV